MTNRKIQYWVIPPDADAEFAACMEDVLEIYARSYNAAFPGWRKVSARPCPADLAGGDGCGVADATGHRTPRQEPGVAGQFRFAGLQHHWFT